jgi:hypothetical protein
MNDVAVMRNGLTGSKDDGAGSEGVRVGERLRGVGVVGLGYWGPNWVRNLYQSRSAERVVACDLDVKRREHIERSVSRS